MRVREKHCGPLLDAHGNFEMCLTKCEVHNGADRKIGMLIQDRPTRTSAFTSGLWHAAISIPTFGHCFFLCARYAPMTTTAERSLVTSNSGHYTDSKEPRRSLSAPDVKQAPLKHDPSVDHRGSLKPPKLREHRSFRNKVERAVEKLHIAPLPSRAGLARQQVIAAGEHKETRPNYAEAHTYRNAHLSPVAKVKVMDIEKMKEEVLEPPRLDLDVIEATALIQPRPSPIDHRRTNSDSSNFKISSGLSDITGQPDIAAEVIQAQGYYFDNAESDSVHSLFLITIII